MTATFDPLEQVSPGEIQGSGEQPPSPAKGPVVIRAIDRGMAVLRAFSGSRVQLSLAEVASEAGISRAAARRILLTFVELGYVGMGDGRFFLRPRILELGIAYLSGLTLREIALPHMEQLSAEVGESCSLAVLDAQDVVYVARIPVRRIITGVITIGTRFPAYATSLGRVLLAGLEAPELDAYLSKVWLRPFTERTVTSIEDLEAALEEVRRDGYALVEEELEVDLVSVAAPVHDGTGRVIAAVNIATNAHRRPVQGSVRLLLPALKQTAGAIDKAFSMATAGVSVSMKH